MKKHSVRNLAVRGRRVFVRVDFNVPLIDDGTIRTDVRIRASLPTIRLLLEQRASAILLASHLGKPKGKPDPKLSLRPVAERLEELLEQSVIFAPDCIGPETEKLIANAPAGTVILLENLRFHPGEETNDPDFANRLAALADEYVNDAFGTAHRAHASTSGIAEHYERPSTGLLLEREIDYLSRVIEQPEPPFTAIIGGAKVSDKTGVIRNLLSKVDSILIGGGVSHSFLKARGLEIGRSLFEPELVETAGQLATDPKLRLPTDIVVGTSPNDSGPTRSLSVEEIPADMMGLDIGPETAESYHRIIRESRTVIWAGPMGVFENDRFARGSETVARAVVEATNRGATTVVGGGDTIACLARWELVDKVSHASTGGGACLEFLEGRKLPGIEALADAT